MIGKLVSMAWVSELVGRRGGKAEGGQGMECARLRVGMSMDERCGAAGGKRGEEARWQEGGRAAGGL